MKKSTAFTFSFLLLTLLLGCSEKRSEKLDTRPLVRVGMVTNGVEFADALRVQGTVRTRHSALVAARVPGTIDALLVEEGAFVKAGTPMFRVDRVNLENAVMLAKAADLKAQLDFTRLKRLVAEGAVTRDTFEKAEVAAKSTALKLAVAEKNFADSEVCAPFDGIVTQKKKNAGDFVGAGMAVFAMDDPSVYEICISLNAALYGRVTVGKTEVALRAGEGERSRSTVDLSKLPVTYKSPSVNPVTRTFEIRAVVPKADDVAAGMIADCEVVFARRRSQAVPATAVALRGGSDVLFKVADGKAVRVAVEAGSTANGLREIVSPTLAPDDAIITEGMLLVNEGDEVRTMK